MEVRNGLEVDHTKHAVLSEDLMLELHNSIDVLIVFLVFNFIAIVVLIIVINVDIEFLVSGARDLRRIDALMYCSLALINISKELQKLRWLILNIVEVTLVFLDISSIKLTTLIDLSLLRILFFHQVYAQSKSTTFFGLVVVIVSFGTSLFHYRNTNRVQRLRQLSLILVNEVVVPGLEQILFTFQAQTPENISIVLIELFLLIQTIDGLLKTNEFDWTHVFKNIIVNVLIQLRRVDLWILVLIIQDNLVLFKNLDEPWITLLKLLS